MGSRRHRCIHTVLGEGSDWAGPAEVEPLTEVDAGGPHAFERGVIFDSFGHGANVERPSEADDRLDHVAIGLVRRQIPNELDVDLELSNRQLLEVDEAPESGAEVIDGQSTTQTRQI